MSTANFKKCFLVFTLALCAGLAAKDGLIFYCSFDGSINAAKSAGVPAGKSFYGAKPEFAPGIKNKGLRIGKSADGKIKHAISYAGLKNINHKQGTISFWIKPVDWNPDSKDFALFVTGLKKGGHFFIYKYSGSTVRCHLKDDKKESNSIARTTGWKKGQWHHMAVAWNPKQQQLFVDGKLASTVKRALDPDQPYNALFVGTRNWTVEKGFSVIDELKIHNRVLTAAEIKAEYAKFSGKKAK